MVTPVSREIAMKALAEELAVEEMEEKVLFFLAPGHGTRIKRPRSADGV